MQMSHNLTRANCYVPIDGGWRIRITEPVSQGEPMNDIGVCTDNPRKHLRPLYPPADRGVFLERLSTEAVARYPLRPVILAFNEPRFVFDFHRAGGLLGHLLIGLAMENGASRWFHHARQLDVSYVRGRMEYALRDEAIPDVSMTLSAVPLAEAAGLAIRWDVAGLHAPASLVICYGGASGCSDTHVEAQHVSFDGFTPEQCVYDEIRCTPAGFALHRTFDQPGGPCMFRMPEFMPVPPGYEALIQGGSSPVAGTGFGDPAQVISSPSDLLASVAWHSEDGMTSRMNRVAVQRISLQKGAERGYCAVGMGKAMKEAVVNPESAYEAGRSRTDEIARRIVLSTPDQHLNSAACMIPFVTEGTWGDLAYVHGGWCWRWAYLGWRIWYGPDICGWTDRVKTSILNHIKLSLIHEGPDAGAIWHNIEGAGQATSYNMNEVFLDHVRHYFDYTADFALMRKIFPVLKGILEWEGRRLQPENEGLYENALNTWVSDSHWYIRAQCTQASAYMLRAHEFVADLAKRLGEDPAPWQAQAARIRATLQRKLWMRRPGVFAEALDTLGCRLLHPEPELATIYHAAEFAAVAPLHIYQMLHWADTHMRCEATVGGGKQYWTSNWHPNRGRSYTHSTCDTVYGENLNYALANYSGGRPEHAYAIIRATLVGIYNGPSPGGLSCQNLADGRQRYNPEFADSTSMWLRAVVEGMFGIVPRRQDAVVELTPQFPLDWPEASIQTPHFSYAWRKDGSHESIHWESPIETAVRLRLPVRATRIHGVAIDGRPAEYQVERGVGLTWVTVTTPLERKGSIEVSCTPARREYPGEIRVKVGDDLYLDLSAYGASGFWDPQGVVKSGTLTRGVLSGRVECEPGPALLFIEAGNESCLVWMPLALQVVAAQQIPPKVWSPPKVKDKDLRHWTLVDCTSVFNSPLTDVPKRVIAAAKPPSLPASQVGFNYWIDHLKNRLSRGRGQQPMDISDAAWRNKVGSDGVAWTADGIPFLTRKEGDNMAVVTRAGGFPLSLTVLVPHICGRILYLMISGITWPAQSHVVNLRVTTGYCDGKQEVADMTNPFGIGDCWDTWLGSSHDTAANGFENLGGRFGPAGSIEVADMTQPVEVDTEAHIVQFELRQNIQLVSIALEAIANDVIFGLMGASVMKGELDA